MRMLGVAAEAVVSAGGVVVTNCLMPRQEAMPMAMTAVAKTFRYLDEEELAKVKKDKAAQAKGGKK